MHYTRHIIPDKYPCIVMPQIVHSPLRYLQQKLDGTAMYRTVTIALAILATFAIFFGFLGIIPYGDVEQLAQLMVALIVGVGTNVCLSRMWRIPANHESAVITALILHFLVSPPFGGQWADLWFIAAAVFLAIVSKFCFVWNGQHLLNPAATGAVALALLVLVLPDTYFETNWWVAQRELFLPLLVVGAAVVAKVRKWVPVLSFLGVAFVTYLVSEWQFFGTVTLDAATNFWLSGPSLFLAFFMLTEPFTMPPRKPLQAAYGAVVGVLSQTTVFMSMGVKMTPELALVIANAAFFPATLRKKLFLTLKEVRTLATNTFAYVFEKPQEMHFLPGQYLEWMLPHAQPDHRGIRRYFTIASAPESRELVLAARVVEKGSSYKRALQALHPGDQMIASQLAGDFILPTDTTTKLAFVAGGIGITPFMSHLGHMSATRRASDTVLFYCNNVASEIAYRDQLAAYTTTIPFRVVHVLAKEQVPGMEEGYLTADMITRHTPDYRERTWYLSGPPGMVQSYTKLLRSLGVPRRQIMKDFFPGLA